MKAIDLLLAMVLIPLITSFAIYWYGFSDIFPQTINKYDSIVNSIISNVNKVINPDYGIYDVIGGMLGSAFSIIGFILSIPELVSTFIYESVSYLGLVQIAPFVSSIAWVLVALVYVYYGKVILGWINPSFFLSNKL